MHIYGFKRPLIQDANFCLILGVSRIDALSYELSTISWKIYIYKRIEIEFFPFLRVYS